MSILALFDGSLLFILDDSEKILLNDMRTRRVSLNYELARRAPLRLPLEQKFY